MPNTDKSEKSIKQLFIGNCWAYLNDNFHKFTETNKIKIALELCKKDMPTTLEGGLSFTKMPKVSINGVPLEVNIGESPSTTDPKDTTKVTGDTGSN